MRLLSGSRKWMTVRKQDRPNEYYVWYAMLKRCLDPNDKSFHNYGAKGITVCDRWRESFDNFIADMGIRPDKGTIDRINNHEGYSPENCKWSTRAEQNRNNSRTRLFTHDGQTMCMTDWATKLNISKYTILARLKKGWILEKAILTPPLFGRRNNERTG